MKPLSYKTSHANSLWKILKWFSISLMLKVEVLTAAWKVLPISPSRLTSECPGLLGTKIVPEMPWFCHLLQVTFQSFTGYF